MNSRIAFAIAALLLPYVAFAQKQEYAIPLQKDVPVYQNQIRRIFEKPAFTAGNESRLLVIENGSSAVRVEDREGRVGWVEKRLVRMVGESRTLKFEAKTVEPYPELRDPIVVVGDPFSQESPVELNRSFADAMRENVDRETIERQVN
jgi:hypothetical protein